MQNASTGKLGDWRSDGLREPDPSRDARPFFPGTPRIDMARFTETVATLNSTVRTALASVALFFLGGTGWVVYDKVTKDQRELEFAQNELANTKGQLGEAQKQIGQLDRQLEKANDEIERLETSMRLLTLDTRLARLDVLDQQTSEDDQTVTTVRFTELTPDGAAADEGRTFQLLGELIYLDNWVVKFEDRFVEEANLQRGTSLALFRRIFGEQQRPADGFELDEVGLMPQAYARGGKPSQFEQEIWDAFWTFANDREKAKTKGIRAAHGEAISIKAEPGKSYRITLRASDGLSIVPVSAD